MQFFDIHIVGIVSSVSARKLMCPSSARLGTFLARARAGKFQLELISIINTHFEEISIHILRGLYSKIVQCAVGTFGHPLPPLGLKNLYKPLYNGVITSYLIL